MPKSTKGFTLIELIIAVAIISILAVIAVPSYLNHMQRSHRGDAMSALLRIAAEQEKFYFNNSRYATLAELGSPTTEHGWYTLSVSENDADTFTAEAIADSGGPQFADKTCREFVIDAAGIKTAFSVSPVASRDDCWR